MLERPVVLLTAGSALGSGAITAVAVLLPAYLRLDGWGATAAAASTGALGAVQVGGRVVLTRATRRLRAAVAAALMLALQAGGIAALLLIGGPAGMVIFVILFGLGYGVLNIARPDLLARYAPRPLFARMSGIQAMLVTGAEAPGPSAAAILRAVTSSYVPVFAAVAASSVTAALLLIAGERGCCPDGMTLPGPPLLRNRWGGRRLTPVVR
jgi:MFS family permease